MRSSISNRAALLITIAVGFIAILMLGCTDSNSFMTKAAQGGMMEVELGQVALQRASGSAIKQFAQQIITDHTQANNELKQLAARKGIQLPTEVSAEQRSMIDKLSKLNGQEFDKEYMMHMVEDHEKDVKEFQSQAESGADADVKAFAGKTLPTLQKHLQISRDTVAKITP